jgi:hypothetical protein
MFGKPPISGIPTYGAQQFISAGRRAPNTGGGGGREFHWKDTYHPPVAPSPSAIGRFIPGTYHQQWLDEQDGSLQEGDLPFYILRQHHNGRASCICSGGVYWRSKEKRLPCPSCDIYWEDYSIRSLKKANGDNSAGPKRISVCDYFAFNWWDYGLHYYSPRYNNKTGQPVINRRTNQPYMEWVRGEPNDPRYNGCQFKWGHLWPWYMSGTDKEELDAYTKEVSGGCANCGGRGSITTLSRHCNKCGAVFYDANTTLTAEQRAVIDYTKCKCPSCGNVDFTVEKMQCSGCTSPKRASLFDVDLEIIRSQGQKNNQRLRIRNYSEPRPIQVAPDVLAQIQPFDLAKKFAPTPPEEQLRIMGIGAMRQNMAQPGIMGQPYGTPSYGVQAVYGAGVAAPPPQMQMVPQMAPQMAPPGMSWPQPQMPTQQPQMPVQAPAFPPQQFQPVPMPSLGQAGWAQPQVVLQPQAQQPPAVPYDEEDQAPPDTTEGE